MHFKKDCQIYNPPTNTPNIKTNYELPSINWLRRVSDYKEREFSSLWKTKSAHLYNELYLFPIYVVHFLPTLRKYMRNTTLQAGNI